MTQKSIIAEKPSVAAGIARSQKPVAKKLIIAEKPSVANDIARDQNYERALAR
jgi:DNA topoisomerase IA